MDALRGIGHACGHNLIGMSGNNATVRVSHKHHSDFNDVISQALQLLSPSEQLSKSMISQEKSFFWALPVSKQMPFNCILCFLQAIIAEEGGSGKVKMLEAGAYDGMAACLMYVVVSSLQSMVSIQVVTLGATRPQGQ